MTERWDFKEKVYKPYQVPQEATIFENDHSKMVKCASCQQPLIYGLSYCSKQIQQGGFGYAICSECYDREWTERRESGGLE